MRRTLALLAALSVLIVPSIVVRAEAEEPPPEPCGLTTLDATLVINEDDGTLECDDGQEVVTREELALADPARVDSRVPLTSFFAIADVQLADEESPARGEGVDPCPPAPGVSSSAFRPQETMVPHLMNAHIRAANAIAAAGGPHLGGDFDFLVGLGDLADNQQYNEIRWIIDIIDGGKLVDPNSGDDPVLGGEGYDGPQADDPTGAGGRTTEDVAPDLPGRILDLANEPFWATGFRLGNDHAAERLPWYSLPGNHDVKVQGTLPDELTGRNHDDMKAWRAIYRSYYIGRTKVVFQDLPPDYKQELCAAFEEEDPERVVELLARIFGDPENALRSTARKIVPHDDERMPLYRSQQIKQPGDEELCKAVAAGRPRAKEICESSWIDEHRITDGHPIGHGYGEADDEGSPRCRDADGNLLERACYSFTSDDDLFHYIALDTNPPEGAERGNIDPAQFEWIERELIANSTTYFDEDGGLVENEDPDASDRLIVVLAHHPTTHLENQMPISPGRVGEDFIELLLRFPNVILNVNGHTHRNQIWPRGEDDDRPETGYWEINTSAIADRPTQSRVVEIADNRDGTLSIFGTVFDALVAPNAEDIDWDGHDHTHELDLAEGTDLACEPDTSGEPDHAPEGDPDHAHEGEPGHSHGQEQAEDQDRCVKRNINEDWLASWGREVLWHDPNHDRENDLMRLGTCEDRNVELLLPAPTWLVDDPTTIPIPNPTRSPAPIECPDPTVGPDPTESPSPDPTFASPSPDPTDTSSPEGDPDPTDTSEELVQRGPCTGFAVGSTQPNEDDPSGVGQIIVGTDGDDILRGTSGDDIICGLAGDDRIRGGPGDDLLVGGPGDDTIFGGPGSDDIRGNQGHDDLRGNRGRDTIRGGAGRDTLRGGPGNDRLFGGPGNDRLFGGPGNDRLFGGPGNDRLFGGPGNDRLFGGRGFDRCWGRQGNNVFRRCQRIFD